MPNTAQHTARVKQGLAAIALLEASGCYETLVNEYFYTCLHMVEATHYELLNKQHCDGHQSRQKFFRDQPYSSAWFEMGVDYDALRKLSEKARYLGPLGTTLHSPLDVAHDVKVAKDFFEAISKRLASLYKAKNVSVPWAAPLTPPSTGISAAGVLATPKVAVVPPKLSGGV